MSDYRAYILDRDGRIQSAKPFACDDDDAAIAAAKQLVDGHDVELWQGARKIITLTHQTD